MRKRLFWQLFGGFFLVVVLTTVVVATLGRIAYSPTETQEAVRPVAEFAVESLGLNSTDPSMVDKGLAKASQLGLAVALFDADGALIGESVHGLTTPQAKGFKPGHTHFRGESGYLIDLPDGRWFSAARLGQRTPPRRAFLLVLVIFIAIAALGCLLLARRIIGRVVALERSVTAWGDGDLGARVPPLGRDEIGRLAARFNDAADRVADLVAAHRQVVAHASHELRTPLTRLRLALTMLADTEDEAKRAALIVSSESDIEDLDALIEQLLLRSKLGAKNLNLAKVPVDLGSVVEERLALLGSAAQGWTLEGSEAPAVVMGDPRMLAQAVDNLLANALKYGGATVGVSIGAEEGFFVVAVTDDGSGVPPADQERIFEPFYQADSGADGVGLGLSLVRDIARWHGGDATYHPVVDPPGGSRFEVRIPYRTQTS